ncbi:unnamed protein product [Brassicogethes aeneus]|uniref:Uncharacterized protein n=1 Tax=Brassicogethes aeneus TaxID=1431903 RepID=A0A9P0AT50_BRAAE|nr:unnamed protein product [Brassicogethes aeneus]
MKQVILTLALFGLAAAGSLGNKYIPANQGYQANANSGYPASGAAAGAYSGAYAGAQGSGSNPADASAPILRMDSEIDENSYRYAYETGNSIAAEEQGRDAGDGNTAQGSFSYTAPDGQQISVHYNADQGGFQPQGAHIPTSPPIPAEILKALEQNAADEAAGIVDDGQYRAEHQGEGAKGAFQGYQSQGGYQNQGNKNNGYKY